MRSKNQPANKEKPFKLIKVFSLTSLALVFAGTIVISGLNIRWARHIQLEKSKEYARVLVENLNHQVFQQFIVPTVLKFRGTELRKKEQFEWMDKVVRSTLYSFDIKTVNIYGMKDIISYSYDKNLIGKKNIGGTGYAHAIKGKSYFKLVQTGNFWEILLGIPKESKLVTFASLKPGKLFMPATDTNTPPPVLGVVEIVQDITKAYRSIFRYQVLIIITSALVMTTLFLIMFYVVRNGEKIIEKRAREQLMLKEELTRAKHLSSLGEMTAGISHEIRNPLGIIRSSAELLNKQMATLAPDNKIPAVIVEEATRLDNIISDFLNYARPKIPNRLAGHIDKIIEKIIAFLSPELEAGGHTVSLRVQEDLPEVFVDVDMLHQAFLNIMINAMQAMPDGGNIEIIVRTEGEKIRIQFDNEGRPIDAENLEKIWEPFFTTKDTGTGLGLGIVQNIIQAHDGRIRIENIAEKGVRVLVTLPIS
ncbi:MAG: two-component sensor histidine kinase [Deltaproteobacteria bacterium]|nr:MAG: two-component sensor histidine kinase [Deltaproteobacteria bacterium]